MTKEQDKKFKEVFNKATDRLLDTLNNNPDEFFDIKNLTSQLADKSREIYNLVRENKKLQSKIDQQDQIIREARELVTSRLKECEEYNCCGMQPEYKEELLEILDRNVK